ncbi:MAG: MFS transporter [Spirochaetaceae bacterium]|nr:MAG: MFS transporter [Spirochaetaceae bacterium]
MDEGRFRLRSLVLPFYIPAFLWSTGAGFLLPVLPLHIRSLGATLSETGMVMASYAVGAIVGNLPTVGLVARFGKKRTIIAALLLEVFLAVAAYATRSLVVLAVMLFGLGVTHTMHFVSRLAFFRELVPTQRRGRALSLLGGETRMGSSLGPVIGGIVAQRFGGAEVFLLFSAVSVVVAGVVTAFVPADPPAVSPDTQLRQPVFRAIPAVFAQYQRLFLTAGFAVFALKLVREARKVIFPLWGDRIGMSVAHIGALFSVSYIVEMALFYPAGSIMDRWGRKKTAVPCLAIFAVGFLVLPLATRPVLFAVVALILAVGNGLGSGINMTLSTDFAPPDGVVEFLVTWRVVTDIGGAASPVLVGVVASAVGLAWSSPLVALVSLSGALVMAFLVREPLRSTSSPTPSRAILPP